MGILDDLEREQKRIEKQRQQFMEKSRIDNGWRKNLRPTKNGRSLMGDARNVELALTHAPELMAMVRFNEMSSRIVFTRNPPWSERDRIGDHWNDDDSCGLMSWLQDVEVPVSSSALASEVVHMHAREHHHFHPVRDWLSSLQWDGQARIEDVLTNVLGASGNLAYVRIVLRKFMIAAVARAMEPACKVDTMLVLTGPQDAGKSTFVGLLGAPWAIEGISAFGTKDAVTEIREAWIVEVSELSGMRRSEIETVKSFVSRRVDHYRPPYARNPISQPRCCVFIGTTNDEHFLLDTTGNRRYWPVRCGKHIDLTLLEREREQLWAEAVAAYQRREKWHLTKEEKALASEAQEQHRIVPELENDVANYLAQRIQAHSLCEPLVVTVTEVYLGICGKRDLDSLGNRRAVEMEIGRAIRLCEWVPIGRHGKDRHAGYQTPTPEVNT